MINNKLRRRVSSVAIKCQQGGSAPSKTQQYFLDKAHNDFASSHGWTWDGTNFKDKLGNTVNLTDQQKTDLDGVISKAGITGSYVWGANEVFNIGESLLASNPNIDEQSNTTQGINKGYDMANGLVDKINPLAGMIMRGAGFASDTLTAFGVKTDQKTMTDKIMDSKLLKLTPVGLANDIGASKTQDFAADTKTVEQVGSSYGGTVADINKAVNESGKSYGLFSQGAKNRMNRFINNTRQKQNLMADIAKTSSDQHALADNMGDEMSRAYLYSMNGGYDQRFMRAKNGGQLPEPEFKPDLILDIEKIVPENKEGGLLNEKINPDTGTIEPWSPELITEPVEQHKQGGAIEKKLDAPETEPTEQKNLIPEGALHKNKHHMEDAEDLTKKGIPVVDDEHNQQAEIEKEEIIFTKEVTTKLEELYHEFYNEETTQKRKDELAIEAGKLLTKEIMLNTDDRAGLIDTLKQGGQLKPLTKNPGGGFTVKTYEGKELILSDISDDQRQGRKPVGKDSNGNDLYLNGDGLAILPSKDDKK